MNTPNPDLGLTADGVPIVDNLLVITNEMRVGKIRLDRYRASDDGWFDVEYADGRRVMQNSERVATRFGTRSAKDVWAEETGTTAEVSTIRVGDDTVPVPAAGHISHIATADIVVMRHDDWLAVREAVMVAKGSGYLDPAQRARLAAIQIATFDHVDDPDTEAGQ